MRISVAVAGIAFGLAFALPAFAATKSVSIQNFAFNPSSISIHAGDTVKWTQNQIGETHTVTSDDGRFTSSGDLNYTNTYSVTFTKAGTYNYMCSIHNYMTGTITVTGSTSTPTPTPTHKAAPTPTQTKPKPTATATAKPTVVPVSPTPTSSAKPSPRASTTLSPASTPSSTPDRVVAEASSSSSQTGVTVGLIAGALVIIAGVALLVVRKRRTIP
jgi:plastocyanin